MSFLNKCQPIWFTSLVETFQWLSTALGIKSLILPQSTTPCTPWFYVLLTMFPPPGGTSVRPLDQGALPSPKSPAPFVSLLPYPFDLYQSFVSQLKVGSTETLFLIPNCFLHFPFIAREMKAVYYVEFLCVVNFFKVGLPTGL